MFDLEQTKKEKRKKYFTIDETINDGEKLFKLVEIVTYAKWDGSKTNVSKDSTSDDSLSDGTTISSIDTTTGTSGFGGFWIGRYEAGIDVDLGTNAQTKTSNRDTEYAPIIVGVILRQRIGTAVPTILTSVYGFRVGLYIK